MGKGMKGLLDLAKRERFQLTPEEAQQLSAAKAAVNEEYREFHDNADYRREVAAVLVESLDYGFSFEDLFGTYLNYEQVGFTDRPVIRERRGMKVFAVARGGYIEQSNLEDDLVELPRDGIGFHVSAHEDELLVGFADQMVDLIRLGGARLSTARQLRLFRLLDAAVAGDSDFITTAAGLDKSDLDSAITAVKDAQQPDGVGRLPITVIGRATMVDQISDFTGFGFEALEEIRILGRLGTYRGANIVQVTNYADENGVSFIPPNKLWIFAGNVGKFVTYGTPKVKDWQDGGSEYVHHSAKIELGGLVNHPERARIIEDSTQDDTSSAETGN